MVIQPSAGAAFHLRVHFKAHLQLVLLAVDDDGGDLLVHEDEDDGQQGRDGGRQGQPPGVAVTPGVDHPATVVTCGLQANNWV